MKKSVYSLVLTDDVVARVDQMAYLRNTNRSNLINQILAEYVSCTTPEMRMREVFDRIGNLLGGVSTFQPIPQPSDCVLAFRSALVYKYNPTVRYSVVLYRNELPVIGELRVGFRTQSRDLIDYMMRFYRLWMDTEQQYIGGGEYTVEGGKMTRKLVIRQNKNGATLKNETVGEIIAGYINAFDEALKLYFENPQNLTSVAAGIDGIYRKYITNSKEII